MDRKRRRDFYEIQRRQWQRSLLLFAVLIAIFHSRLFNSHPPLMKRIRLLAQQAKLRPAQVIEQVWESQKIREGARGTVHSFEETASSVSAERAGGPIPASEEQKV